MRTGRERRCTRSWRCSARCSGGTGEEQQEALKRLCEMAAEGALHDEWHSTISPRPSH